MGFERVSWKEAFSEALEAIHTAGGLLLVTRGKHTGKPNVMTIGWVLLGTIWGKPIATVLVRPSRFTYTLLEEHPHFTINIPPQGLSNAVAICGQYSGKDMDKFAHCALTPIYLDGFPVPSIEECTMSIQCTVVAKTLIRPETLAIPIQAMYYQNDDYHTSYFGEIQATWKLTPVS